MTEAWAVSDGPLHDPEGNACWPISELINNGLLWAINTYVAHPRGYAIWAHFEDDACEKFIGLSVHSNDSMPMVYPNDDNFRLMGMLFAEMMPSPPKENPQ